MTDANTPAASPSSSTVAAPKSTQPANQPGPPESPQPVSARSAEILHAEQAFASRAKAAESQKSTTPAGAAKTQQQQEEDRRKKTASVEGARSIAEAVRRVTDEAVAAIQKTEVKDQDLDFDSSGSPGGNFELIGVNLGSSGTVTLNGVQLHTTEWSTLRIRGVLPAGATAGEVIVHIDDKTSRRGMLRI